MWNYYLSIQINLLPLMTNLQHISLNGHFSSHLKNTPMNHNSPNIYLPWPSKATPILRFKNGGLLPFLPSANIYQHTRAGQHKISQSRTSQHVFLSSPTRHISNWVNQYFNFLCSGRQIELDTSWEVSLNVYFTQSGGVNTSGPL